jgi:hypothetical protein
MKSACTCVTGRGYISWISYSPTVFHLPSPRRLFLTIPSQTLLAFPQPFLLASFLPVNITTLSRLMPPPIMLSPEQTPYSIHP